jgi:hypothetical protein
MSATVNLPAGAVTLLFMLAIIHRIAIIPVNGAFLGQDQVPRLTFAVNRSQAAAGNVRTGPSGSCESRTPTTAPSCPTSAQLPLKALCEDFRHAATSAQFPFAKL